MTDELAMLLALGITDTEIRNIPIPATGNLQKGFPIGQGKCKAVKLYLNVFVMNTQTAAGTPVGQRNIYCGNASEQKMEITANVQSSYLFIIDDLNKLFVRGNGLANENLFAIIYR